MADTPELIESKKAMRDTQVKLLEKLKFDGTDKFTETDIRDQLIVLSYLMGYEPDNQIFTLEDETLTIACWKLDPPDPEFTTLMQNDLIKIDNKIKKEKEKKGGK